MAFSFLAFGAAVLAWKRKLSGRNRRLLRVRAANATVINLGTIDTATTISSSVGYAAGELVFEFTIDSPYSFTFLDNGSGGDFPFPIATTPSGEAGTYTETFGAFPVYGTPGYTLTTSGAVLKPATWALILVGFGAMGMGLRTRTCRTPLTA